MKKILFIISMLIVFSCDQLEEQTEFLEYDKYMEEGWEAFQASDWETASYLFESGLNQTSSNYSEAYSGLGWTYLYEANRLYGESNKLLRDELRSLAGDNFKNAENEDKYDFDIWSDILAGMTYIYSYKADSVLYMYYNDVDFQLDTNLMIDMEEYSYLDKTNTRSIKEGILSAVEKVCIVSLPSVVIVPPVALVGTLVAPL